MDFTLLFIYFITVNNYRFCISVIGYIIVQIIGIGNKKNLYWSITSSMHDGYILYANTNTSHKTCIGNLLKRTLKTRTSKNALFIVGKKTLILLRTNPKYTKYLKIVPRCILYSLTKL